MFLQRKANLRLVEGSWINPAHVSGVTVTWTEPYQSIEGYALVILYILGNAVLRWEFKSGLGISDTPSAHRTVALSHASKLRDYLYRQLTGKWHEQVHVDR